MVNALRIQHGTRCGFWNPNPGWDKSPFTPCGIYTGPDLGSVIPGTAMQQELMEGTLHFRVGVLFRPDLGKYQKLETIIILNNWIPEMFEYEDWEVA